MDATFPYVREIWPKLVFIKYYRYQLCTYPRRPHLSGWLRAYRALCVHDSPCTYGCTMCILFAHKHFGGASVRRFQPHKSMHQVPHTQVMADRSPCPCNTCSAQCDSNHYLHSIKGHERVDSVRGMAAISLKGLWSRYRSNGACVSLCHIDLVILRALHV